MNIEQVKFPLKDKLDKNMKKERKIKLPALPNVKLNFLTLSCAALCFLLPMARTSSGIYVFVWSFMAYACVKKKNEFLLFPALSLVLPLFLYGWEELLKFAAVYGALLAYPYVAKGELNILSCAFFTSGVVLIVSLCSAFINGALFVSVIYAVCESLLCICFVPVFTRAMDCVENLRRKTLFTTQDRLCLCTVLTAASSSLCFLSIKGACVSVCLGAFFIGICMAAFDSASAVSLCVLCGSSLYVFSGFPFSFAALWAVGGVCGIMFKELSKTSSIVIFYVISALGSFLIMPPKSALPQCIAMLCGCAAAVLLLPKALAFAAKLKNRNAHTPAALSDTLASVVKDEVSVQKNMLNELSRNVQLCEVENDGDIAKAICRVVAGDICAGCIMKNQCWAEEGEDTYMIFNELIKRCVINPAVSYNNLPNRFISKCAHNQVMYKTICCIYDGLKMKQDFGVKLGRFKNIINSQFVHLNRILDRLNDKISYGMKLNSSDSEEVLNALQNDGLNAAEAYVMENSLKKQLVIIKSCDPMTEDELNRSVPMNLGEALGKDFVFDHKSVSGEKNKTYSYTFTEEYPYRLSTGFAACCKENGEYSGDKNSDMILSNGMHMLAICDGMGTGRKAGAQSGRVLDMLEEMLNCGYDETEAIDMINSILVLDESDEIFTALDLFLFDLNKGVGEFVKAGASPSFIKRGNKAEVINYDTLPVGILEETHIKKGLKKFQKGDLIYFMSDGYYESVKNDDAYIIKKITECDLRNPQRIAEALFADALERSEGKACDDISVLVVKVRQTALA